MNLPDAQKYCRELSRHYENFTAGSWLFPRRMRQDLANVYAYCRYSDDLADESENSIDNLKQWGAELAAILLEPPRHPILIALRSAIEKYDLPLTPFKDLLSAFRQDQYKTRYGTFRELMDYCQRSANPVGRIYLMLFALKDEELFRLSDEICTGLQLANFWQDVAVDLRKGRIYLPQEDMKRFEYDETRLQKQEYCREFRELLQFECDRTAEFFRRGSELERRLPKRLKLEVRLFRRGGELVLKKIRGLDYNVLEKRLVIGKADKVGIFLRSIIS